ncbi:MAG: nickel pincer cofactor biosynthesis protein LarB [Spirochaetales bacterium]|nr:nickel pincer cofactor biosynthesis protein LarB [Spirochaetales bacterium]
MDNSDKTIDLGFAKLDMERGERTGFKEVIFCQGKIDLHLLEICVALFEKNGEVFGTRATEMQSQMIKKIFAEKFPCAAVDYDEVSKILIIRKEPMQENHVGIGNIAVCTAGTADIPVGEEAARTAEYFGANVERFYDVGVAGLHRLLDRIDEIRKASAVVAVAGMEGALASVIGGLVKVPVICVPTSVGYGANLGGLSALLSMLNSCANGISVVNIDNGYGAGYIAAQINRLAEGIK